MSTRQPRQGSGINNDGRRARTGRTGNRVDLAFHAPSGDFNAAFPAHDSAVSNLDIKDNIEWRAGVRLGHEPVFPNQFRERVMGRGSTWLSSRLSSARAVSPSKMPDSNVVKRLKDRLSVVRAVSPSKVPGANVVRLLLFKLSVVRAVSPSKVPGANVVRLLLFKLSVVRAVSPSKVPGANVVRLLLFKLSVVRAVSPSKVPGANVVRLLLFKLSVVRAVVPQRCPAPTSLNRCNPS